jgi:cellulose synthase (UDP-forming)
VAASALGCGGLYLGYRLSVSWRGADPYAFAVLSVVELYNFISLAFLAFYGWRWSAPVRPAASPGWTVDVFVATYDEGRDVVEATLAGCAALSYPHRTYLLDDGRREEMAELARKWGATWVTRPDNAHAKAGNINHALSCTEGELIFCLDADHVPLPDALDALVGYFDDPACGLVQSPHDFYNHDSVQHFEVGRHEQSLFFEVVCPGKDRHNGVFWCGSATLVRRAALVGAGGVSTETIAEDFHSTIKMHRNGWVTHYHDEVLVQGLAPLDLDGYLLQRDRWARGNLAVLRLPESPLGRKAGLSWRQRVSYAGSLFAYGAGAARLGLIALLIATLAGGVLPARMSLSSLETLWVPWTILAMTASTALCRGHLRAAESSHYTLLTAEIFTRALRCAIVPSRTKFKVTPKSGGDVGGAAALRHIRLVLCLGVVLSLSIFWRVLGLVGVVPVRRLPVWAAVFAIVLGCWELARIARSARRVARRHQRRQQVRFACSAPAVVTGLGGGRSYARVTDVSVAGIGLVSAYEGRPGDELVVTFALEDLDGAARLAVTARLVVRSVWPAPGGGWHLGTSIVELDEQSRVHLVRYGYVVAAVKRLRETTRRYDGSNVTVLAPLVISGDAGAAGPAVAAEREQSEVAGSIRGGDPGSSRPAAVFPLGTTKVSSELAARRTTR